MFKRLKNQRGFTLIELIAVISILGILAALVVPRVGDYTQRARIAKAKGEINILKNAIERYNAEHNNTLNESATLSSVQAQLTGKTDVSGNSGTDFGPYIDKLPLDSVSGESTIEGIMAFDTDNLLTSTGFPVKLPLSAGNDGGGSSE